MQLTFSCTKVHPEGNVTGTAAADAPVAVSKLPAPSSPIVATTDKTRTG